MTQQDPLLTLHTYIDMICRNPVQDCGSLLRYIDTLSVPQETKRSYLNDAFRYAALKGYNPMVENLLLEEGILIDGKGDRGFTALMYAALTGNSTLVDLLLQWNADPTLQEDRNQTALMLAAKKGHTETVRKLLDEVSYDDMLLALQMANCHHHQEVVQHLKEKIGPQPRSGMKIRR